MASWGRVWPSTRFLRFLVASYYQDLRLDSSEGLRKWPTTTLRVFTSILNRETEPLEISSRIGNSFVGPNSSMKVGIFYWHIALIVMME